MLAYHYSLMALAEESLEDEKRQAQAYLEEVAGRLRADGVSVRTVVLAGWPADVIVYRGANLGTQLAVMATHGRTGLARMLLGSVALEVVRRSPLPILLVRPPSMAEAGSP